MGVCRRRVLPCAFILLLDLVPEPEGDPPPPPLPPRGYPVPLRPRQRPQPRRLRLRRTKGGRITVAAKRGGQAVPAVEVSLAGGVLLRREEGLP